MRKTGISNQKWQEMEELVKRDAPHLDWRELLDNAALNAADVEDQEGCFESTVLMYIDQDCSSF